jgi:hypothetical protein
MQVFVGFIRFLSAVLVVKESRGSSFRLVVVTGVALFGLSGSVFGVARGAWKSSV